MAKTTTAVKKVKWTIQADYLQACNCNYGCPCEFEAPPTKGYCEGVGAWHIVKGRYSDVKLDGLGMAFSVHTPKAMHLGNATTALFIDERATPAQREALLNIATARDGGMPFEIFVAITTKFLPPQFVPIKFHLDGRNSRAVVGDQVRIGLEPIKNPINGAPESIRVEHATGFIFKTAEAVSAKECVSNVAELKFSWPNQAGFFSRVQYGN